MTPTLALLIALAQTPTPADLPPHPDEIPRAASETPLPGPLTPDAGLAPAIPPADAPPVLTAAEAPDAGVPSAGAIVAQAGEVVGAVGAVRAAKPGAATRIAVMLLLAALFRLGISVARAANARLHRQWITVATLTLGVGVFLCSHLALGIPLWQAVGLAMAGPLAQAVDGWVRLLKPSEWAKAAAKNKPVQP